MRNFLDTPPSRATASATVVLLCLIWGTTWSAIRIGLEGLPPFTGVALRFGIAAVVLGVLAARLGLSFAGSAIEWRLWIVHAITAFCISYGATYWAEQWIPSGLGAVLFATFPLFVTIFAHLWLPGDRAGTTAVVGILIGFAGVALIFSDDFSALGGGRALLGSAVMLAAPLASALGNVVVKRWNDHVHPLTLNAAAMAMTAGAMGALAVLFERERERSLDPISVGALLYLSLIGSALTFTLYFWLLKHVRATRLALIAYVVPVIAVAIGAVFLEEPLTGQMIAGGGLVLAGVAIGQRAGSTAPGQAKGTVRSTRSA